MSPVAIAVGCAEGTRTEDGETTEAWYGHTDPGNGVYNKGSFSYQHKCSGPNEADTKQIQKFTDDLLPQFLANINRVNVPLKGIKLLFLMACDVYTQSELACAGRGGFLEQFKSVPPDMELFTAIVEWRVNSYFDPSTGKLDAPGFGNDLARLRADQKRRTTCVETAFEGMKIA